jgi:hypothetical protein
MVCIAVRGIQCGRMIQEQRERVLERQREGISKARRILRKTRE